MKRGLHHIGYWVDDLDAAMSHARDILGLGPFRVMPDIHLDPFEFQGLPAVLDHSAAFAQWGEVFIEFDQVHQVHPPKLAEALGIPHGAVSHVSWAVDDIADEDAFLQGHGCSLLTVAGPNASRMRVDWLDGGPLFAHPVEIHELNRTGSARSSRCARRHERRVVEVCGEGRAGGLGRVWEISDLLRDTPDTLAAFAVTRKTGSLPSLLRLATARLGRRSLRPDSSRPRFES